MKNYYDNQFPDDNDKDHLETEGLIENFKFKYDELKEILNEKIKELYYKENVYKDCLTKFQYKFDELENVNVRLRECLIEKQRENEDLIRQNIELIKKVNDFNYMQDGYSNKMIKEKEFEIDDLNYKLRNIEIALKDKEDQLHHFKVNFINTE